jgi:hypothetical protein
MAPEGSRMVGEADDIYGALGILFPTVPGERVVPPTLGCDFNSRAARRVSSESVPVPLFDRPWTVFHCLPSDP